MSRPSHANRTAAPKRLRSLAEEPPVAAIAELPQSYEALVVGGALRDRFLGRPSSDFDAVVARDGEQAADRLAARLGTRWFRLGGERFAAYRLQGPNFRLDLFDREPMSLDQDLERRDFTVNSMAIDLGPFELIDPFDGRGDIERRRLRATSDLSFEDDPLRVLRLVRFATQLDGFTVEPRTLALARSSATDLGKVASERVREELRALFDRPAEAFELLTALDLYPDLWGGARSTHVAADRVATRLGRLTGRARDLASAGARTDPFLAAQAVLFEPLRGECVDAHRRRGLLSNHDASRIEALLTHSRLPQTDGERRWLLHRAGELWPTLAAYLGAGAEDDTWHRERSTLVELARSEAGAIFAPPPLLDGHEIAELLGLGPGLPLGELVAGLRRAQIEGEVRDRAAAVRWLREADRKA